jgi:amino acid transporter
MTYPPGSPGYPPAQSPSSYGGSTPSFAKSDDSASKLQLYLTIAVVALGLAAYLASFGPMFTISADLGPSGSDLSGGGGGLAIVAALLAALLAAVGLLPKARNYTAIVGAVAVLGALLVIAQTLSRPSGFSIGWALWFVLACTVAQAIVAVGALLLDAGVVTPPAPRPKFDQYAQYGQYGAQPGGYYGQPGGQQHAPFQHHGQQPSPQPSGYGSQYGGYSGPSTGGFGAVGHQQGSQQGAQSGPQQSSQQGPPTPPTGFPSFGQPPSSGSGQGAQGHGQGNSGNQSGSGQGQHQQGQGQQGQQQSPSSPAGPPPS